MTFTHTHTHTHTHTLPLKPLLHSYLFSDAFSGFKLFKLVTYLPALQITMLFFFYLLIYFMYEETVFVLTEYIPRLYCLGFSGFGGINNLFLLMKCVCGSNGYPFQGKVVKSRHCFLVSYMLTND